MRSKTLQPRRTAQEVRVKFVMHTEKIRAFRAFAGYVFQTK